MVKLDKEKVEIKLFEYLDFDKKFRVENKDIKELLLESKDIYLIDKNVPFVSSELYDIKDLIYIVFKEGSKYMNTLYLGKVW